jgi:hypothetical protein
MTARGCWVLTVLLAASAAGAQDRVECDAAWWERWRSSSARVCEIRELTLSARGGLSVDAGPNGSIGVTGG